MDGLGFFGVCAGVFLMLLSNNPDRRYAGMIMTITSILLIIAF